MERINVRPMPTVACSSQEGDRCAVRSAMRCAGCILNPRTEMAEMAIVEDQYGHFAMVDVDARANVGDTLYAYLDADQSREALAAATVASIDAPDVSQAWSDSMRDFAHGLEAGC